MDDFRLIAKSCSRLDENLLDAVPRAPSESQSPFGSKWLTSDSWQCFPSGRNILALHKFLTRFQIAAVSTFSEDQRVSLTKQKVRAEEDVHSQTHVRPHARILHTSCWHTWWANTDKQTNETREQALVMVIIFTVAIWGIWYHSSSGTLKQPSVKMSCFASERLGGAFVPILQSVKTFWPLCNENLLTHSVVNQSNHCWSSFQEDVLLPKWFNAFCTNQLEHLMNSCRFNRQAFFKCGFRLWNKDPLM